MIYNFDFFIHDEHDASEDLTDHKADQSESTINTESECSDPFNDLEQNEKHTILFFEPNISRENLDIWNDDYVKLPFSKFNLNQQNQPIWHKICSSLIQLKIDLKNYDNTFDLGSLLFSAVKKYNSSIKNFDNLKFLLKKTDILEEKFDRDRIIKKVIPELINLTLKLPDLIKFPIPILKSGKTHSISLNQEQCASLLANAFFCTFMDRYDKTENENMPLINFDQLFLKQNESSDELKLEKLKCIFHYFDRITEKIELNRDKLSVITFSRIYAENICNNRFKYSKKKIRIPIISNCSRIEDCKGALQLDFSDKFIGSGTLATGCVQEEIRLNNDECIMIRGVERYSDYTGYAENFKWNGDFIDHTDKDNFNRIMTDILAIDPLFFADSFDQYKEENLWREIKKCFIGFRLKSKFNSEDGILPRIATGNWGCGAYNGDKELKFLIQIIVASEVDRDLIYYTFENPETCRNLIRIIEIITNNSLQVGDTYRILCRYCNKIQKLLHKQETPSSPTDQIKIFFKNVFNIKSNDSLVDYLEHHSKKIN